MNKQSLMDAIESMVHEGYCRGVQDAMDIMTVAIESCMKADPTLVKLLEFAKQELTDLKEKQ